MSLLAALPGGCSCRIWHSVNSRRGNESAKSPRRLCYTQDRRLCALAHRAKTRFFAKQRIEVEFIALRGGVQVAQAAVDDSLQFAQIAGSVVVRSDLSRGDW